MEEPLTPAVAMDVEQALKEIIAKERSDGCLMANERLIAPALRRWRSYERRNRRNKNKSLEHRALDLKKAFLALFPNLNYDEAYLAHLAESFAQVLLEMPQGDSGGHSAAK